MLSVKPLIIWRCCIGYVFSEHSRGLTLLYEVQLYLFCVYNSDIYPIFFCHSFFHLSSSLHPSLISSYMSPLHFLIVECYFYTPAGCSKDRYPQFCKLIRGSPLCENKVYKRDCCWSCR